MDKKTGIILGIIGAIVVILIAIVFVMDTKTVKLDKNTLLIVEGKEYTTNEFEKYSKLYNNENNSDINKKMTEEETLTMMDQFLLHKIYLDAAEKHNVEIPSGDIANFESDYDKDSSKFANANISKEDFIKYKTETRTVEELKYNLDDYYALPDDIYEAVRDSFIEEKMYNTYAYRLMTIPYEAPKSGDASGDTSGDVVDILEEGLSSRDTSGDKEDLSREAQLKVAEDVLAKIKSGDNFEELSKEYGSTRFTFSGNEYKLVNGEIEYTTTPLLESKLGKKELYDVVVAMQSGDVSEVIEDKEGTSFNIIKLESKEDGFVGEGEKELKTILLNEYADDVVAGNAHYEMNQSAYIRALYQK